MQSADEFLLWFVFLLRGSSSSPSPPSPCGSTFFSTGYVDDLSVVSQGHVPGQLGVGGRVRQFVGDVREERLAGPDAAGGLDRGAMREEDQAERHARKADDLEPDAAPPLDQAHVEQESHDEEQVEEQLRTERLRRGLPGPLSTSRFHVHAHGQDKEIRCGDLARFGEATDESRRLAAIEVRLDRLVNGKASSPQPWSLSGSVPPGAPSFSRLAVWASGNEIRFFVNDQYHFSVNDPLLLNGSLGLFARSAGQTDLTVNFSDLVVKEVAN